MKWLERRRVRKAAADAADRERSQRAWHEFLDAMNVARGGEPIPYDPKAYQ